MSANHMRPNEKQVVSKWREEDVIRKDLRGIYNFLGECKEL